MILALDTDVLVAWTMEGDPRHPATRRFIEREVQERGRSLGLAPQVIHEFLHVATDPRRFQNPFSMPDAIRRAQHLWEAPEIVRVLPTPEVLAQTLGWMSRLGLGRKRILDTALAATLELAGIERIATFNRGDFESFTFLTVVDPLAH